MNKIPIEAGAACFISSFFMSVVPNSSSYIFFFFLRATHLVINFWFCTWDQCNLRRIYKDKILIMAHRQF
jgi:hypothetical protein